MAKVEDFSNRSIEDLMASVNTKEARKNMIEYFRNEQNIGTQLVDMVATQQSKGKKGYPSAAEVQAVLQQPTGNQPAIQEQPAKPSDETQYVFVPTVSLRDLQPFKTLSKLTITDWLLVVIAALLLILIIRRK